MMDRDSVALLSKECDAILVSGLSRMEFDAALAGHIA